MTTPQIAVGMATFDDFNGCYFSIQSIRLHHAGVMKDAEIIVVDNNPGSEEGRTVRDFLGWVKDIPCHYVPMPEPKGTAAPRQRVFDEAQAPVVLCMDPHVLFPPGSVAAAFGYFRERLDAADIVSGPMLYDHLDPQAANTHFHPVWRSEMFGIWSTAWICGNCSAGIIDAVQGPPSAPGQGAGQTSQGEVTWWTLGVPPARLETCPACDAPLPTGIPWPAHEQVLRAKGFRPVTESDEPFAIPGCGLGAFACRKETWQKIGGFNSKMRGFGGEELYVHEKVRRAGGRAICLPGFPWLHRYGRPGGPKYPLTRWQKVRNYVLGFAELGWDLGPIHDHFVHGGLMPEHEWKVLADNPTDPPEWPPGTGPGAGRQTLQALAASAAASPAAFPTMTLEDMWYRARNEKSDINEHCDILRKLSSESDVVVEFGMRHGVSTVALLAGQPRKFVSYDLNRDPVADRLREVRGKTDFDFRTGDSLTAEINGDCDLLFIDTKHTAEQLHAELTRLAPKARRWIALHDTEIFGEKGETGGPGLLPALRRYLGEHPEWYVWYHARNNHGLTVLNCRPEEKPQSPVWAWAPGFGPGTELTAILATLGITYSSACDCRARAEQMDRWGATETKEHREEVISWMRDGQHRWGWRDKLSAAAKAVSTGLAFHLNPTDPFPGIVDLAISRAAEKEQL